MKHMLTKDEVAELIRVDYVARGYAEVAVKVTPHGAFLVEVDITEPRNVQAEQRNAFGIPKLYDQSTAHTPALTAYTPDKLVAGADLAGGHSSE